jgi:hypothetical protein
MNQGMNPGKVLLMFRFDRLIHRHMIVREVKQSHPEAGAVFEEFGFRPVCDDCDIETLARKYGLASQEVVDKLNCAVFGPKAETQDAGR